MRLPWANVTTQRLRCQVLSRNPHEKENTAEDPDLSASSEAFLYRWGDPHHFVDAIIFAARGCTVDRQG